MLTASVASSVHGTLRSTQNLDIVISASSAQLQQMIKDYQALGFYADDVQATDAMARRSQFNVIDNVTGWKVDFIFSEATEYGRTALARRETIVLSGMGVQIASAEDVAAVQPGSSKMWPGFSVPEEMN